MPRRRAGGDPRRSPPATGRLRAADRPREPAPPALRARHARQPRGGGGRRPGHAASASGRTPPLGAARRASAPGCTRVCYNRSIDRLRRRRDFVDESALDEHGRRAPSCAETALVRAETARSVREAIERLAAAPAHRHAALPFPGSVAARGRRASWASARAPSNRCSRGRAGRCARWLSAGRRR